MPHAWIIWVYMSVPNMLSLGFLGDLLICWLDCVVRDKPKHQPAFLDTKTLAWPRLAAFTHFDPVWFSYPMSQLPGSLPRCKRIEVSDQPLIKSVPISQSPAHIHLNTPPALQPGHVPFCTFHETAGASIILGSFRRGPSIGWFKGNLKRNTLIFMFWIMGYNGLRIGLVGGFNHLENY